MSARHASSSIATVAELTSSPDTLRILVYSDDATTREKVMTALGTRLHPDLPQLSYLEVATQPMLIRLMDAGGIDLAVLDGEATPAGGMGICKQLKDELTPCPPIVVLTGRADDVWLARWSRADAAVAPPADPMSLSRAVMGLLRAPAAR